MAKKAKQIPEAQLRARLAKEVVDPLFGKSWSAPATAGIPPIVLENRRKREAHSRILEALVSRGSVVIPRRHLQETREPGGAVGERAF
ncbi:MAG: hypothetical protein IPP47_23040 [Bryobacterales bacterium]|nr:hypothetical protein [Bryobacterales bacterium]